MGKKYRIKNEIPTCWVGKNNPYHQRYSIQKGTIIELEPIEEQKETNESLEEKFIRYFKPFRFKGISCQHLVWLAKQHFQEHPEELGFSEWNKGFDEGWKRKCEGMVSLDKVLEVVKEAEKASCLLVFDSLRKSLEHLKNKGL